MRLQHKSWMNNPLKSVRHTGQGGLAPSQLQASKERHLQVDTLTS